MGLVQQDKSYKIKDNGLFFYEKYSFLICTKVLGDKGDYLIPIGYSDEDEWLKQESEYKVKLISDNIK